MTLRRAEELRGAVARACAGLMCLVGLAGLILLAAAGSTRPGGALLQPAAAASRVPSRAPATALNAALRGRLRASYDARAVRLAGAGWSARVGLGAVGRAGVLLPIRGVLHQVAGGARYDATGLSESFGTVPAGIEQSFTVARRPAGRGPLLVEVALSGLRTSGAGARLVLRDAAGVAVGSYGGLRVTDATGHVVRAAMRAAAGGRGLTIAIADGRARYPLRVDPVYVQTAELTAAGGAAGDDFGYAVSVSGSVAVVGAPQTDNEGTGEAFVFTLSGGTWAQTARLTPTDGVSGNEFGLSVAVSGATLVVGAPDHGTAGAAYVYTFANGVWSLSSELTPQDATGGDEFGAAVATSGNTVVVGAPEHSDSAPGSANYDGAVYVYQPAPPTGTAGGWLQTAELTPSDSNPFDTMGGSVGISETGTTVVAGAQASSSGQMAAYVFSFSAATGQWSQAAYLLPGGAASNSLDASVAISGGTIVLGAQYAGSADGAAFVYTPAGPGWVQSATLAPPSGGGGLFGRGVAVSGGTIAVGAFGAGDNEGNAYVFAGSGANWTPQGGALVASDPGGSDNFGFAVAASGTTIVTGAFEHSRSQGSAYVFQPAPAQTGPTFTVTTTQDASFGGCNVGFCTLRDAIEAANANPGSTGTDEIAFDVPGSGPQTIQPQSPLPAATEPVDIDATTQAGYAGTPLIVIDGSQCSAATGSTGCDGLDVDTHDVTVRGLAIVGFSGDGLVLSGGHDTAQQDWVGWSPVTGGFVSNGGEGIEIDNSSGNTIGGQSDTSGDVIAGDGQGALGNGADLEIRGASSANVVSESSIGVGADGVTASGDQIGVEIDGNASGNTIGGADVGNDIYGTSLYGVELDGAGPGNDVAGNTIGADDNGQVLYQDQIFGVAVDGSNDTVIGDDAAPGTQADLANGNVIVGQVDGGGVLIASDNTTVAGNSIGTNRAGTATTLGNSTGVVVETGVDDVIGPGNTIADNSQYGVEIGGAGNQVTANSIHDNAAGGLSLPSSVAPPALDSSAQQTGTATAINGTVTGTPGSSVTVEFFDTATCGNEGASYLGSTTVTIGADHTAPVSVDAGLPSAGDSITATATGPVIDHPGVTTSDFSNCSTVVGGPDNDAWTRAQLIPLNGGGAGGATGSIDLSGQARWYKIPVTPGGTVQVNLSNLPANYDLAMFSDISQAATALTANSTGDLQALEAQMPGNAFAPSIFAPSIFAPSIFAPSIFAPSIFAPSIFAPSIFAAANFSPSIFAPSIFAPSIFAPSIFAPSSSSSSPFVPSIFSPSDYSPGVSIPDEQDYELAQLVSLLSISANPGTANQDIYQDIWNNTGYFYIRVGGSNGVYDPGVQFTLNVQENAAACVGVAPSTAPLLNSNFTVPGPGYQTLILTDTGRMTDDGDLSQMQSDLQTFAGLSSVNGTIVDVGADSPQVAALQTQADANTDCPYADNLVADSIRNIVMAVRAQNLGLKYIVIIGDDHVIPFFRYPDNAGVGPESGYVVPVFTTTPSYASLASDDFLSQDAYGASTLLDEQGVQIPVPDLPVGRLVETPTEIDGMLKAYMSLSGGVVPTPTSSLVTGYDFLASGADAVEANLSAGLGPSATDETLITSEGVAPSDTGTPPNHSWTAPQLENALLDTRHDIIFLGGHFSANNTLAADFSTTMDSTQLASSNVNLENSIVFSAGCHSGYNIAAEDAVPGVTETTDWVGAFAMHQATLIAGTGYQYGDTNFLAYSEQIYANFSQALLYGSGPVAVGEALVNAKNSYLDDTQSLQGIDIKSLLESTLYGLPMLSVNMPDGRIPQPLVAHQVPSPTPFSSNPGATLGLGYDDLSLAPALTTHTVQLEGPTGGSAPIATYLSGPDGVSTSPAAPALPLDADDVSVPGQVLRGVGFIGGAYSDQAGITPLTGAPATELSGVHSTFASSAFFPQRVWSVNYFGGLSGAATGTKLLLTPVQYESDAPGSLTDTQRAYSSVGLRLFYSANTSTYGSNKPALAAPPTIAGVDATVSGSVVTFLTHVVGDPSAGIQQVWVTYTGVDQPAGSTGEWESLDLTQDPVDSSLWTGTLSGLTTQQIANLQFLVQAVNGVGLVSLDNDEGSYYRPGQITTGLATSASLTPTSLQLNSPPSSGAYGSSVPVSATLSADGAPVAGETVTFAVGGSSAEGVTNANGVATVQLSLGGLPGSNYQLTAVFGGDSTYAGTSVSTPSFTISKLPTTLTLSGQDTVARGAQPDVTAVLESSGVGLSRYNVTFVLTPTNGTPGTRLIQTQTTVLDGSATLGAINAATGTYSVQAFFGPGGPLMVPADPIFDASSTTLPFTLTVSGAQSGVTVLGTVASTLSVSVGNATPSLGSFVPGVAATYSATLGLTVTSSAQDATLTAADQSASFPGHLVNTAAGGPYALAQGLHVAASDPAGVPGSGVVSDLSHVNPATLLTYGEPVSVDPVTVVFTQPIGAGDPLRTGTYTKTITFTLSTNTP